MTIVAQTNMIKQQLRTGGVLDEGILALYEKIPRHAFVPAQWSAAAYSDLQISLGNDERMMTPLEEGQLLQSLHLTGEETILEIGTGSGFLTALLSQLSKKVISIEQHAAFTEEAQRKLTEFNCNNVTLISGDASQGWFEKAPYDVIVLSSALEVLPKAFYLQLSATGKLFAIVGKAPVMQAQLYTRSMQQLPGSNPLHSTAASKPANANAGVCSDKDLWDKTALFETNLPPLTQKYLQKAFVF